VVLLSIYNHKVLFCLKTDLLSDKLIILVVISVEVVIMDVFGLTSVRPPLKITLDSCYVPKLILLLRFTLHNATQMPRSLINR
jgi:hypothetical protein